MTTAPPFEPRVAVASLSGESDAVWAREAAPYVGTAFLGGIALDGPTREAARELVARGRTEFLPEDPFEFLDAQLRMLDTEPIRPGWNVRATSQSAISRAAQVCRSHDAILEINAHCRQLEMCRAGAGESLLRQPDQLCRLVRTAAHTGVTVSVKFRTELEGVDLPTVAARASDAGADVVHVDAMDSEPVVGTVAGKTDAFVVANNGVRDRETAREYLAYGADAVSIGRPSDDPTVLGRVKQAVDSWFDAEEPPIESNPIGAGRDSESDRIESDTGEGSKP